MKSAITNIWGSTPVNKLIRSFLFLMLILVPLISHGQDEGDEKESKSVDTSKMQKIQVHFGDELVKGANPSPGVEYIFEKKQFNYKKLMKLRENFIPEAQQGSGEFSAGK